MCPLLQTTSLRVLHWFGMTLSKSRATEPSVASADGSATLRVGMTPRPCNDHHVSYELCTADPPEVRHATHVRTM